MDESNYEVKFISRPYQEKLLEISIKRNSIIYLQTGSGKTYIALMLIKELSSELIGEFNEGGKRTFFIANTVPLVSQQANFIRRHCPLVVGEYYGDRVIEDRLLDFWDKAIWNRELAQNQVLVMTPQILVDMIQHSFIDINKINLLIIDECHHATGNHPYCQILRLYHENEKSKENIRILGLTASIVQKKCNLGKFKEYFRKLEDKFGCKIETELIEETNNKGTFKALFTKPNTKLVQFNLDFEREHVIYQKIMDELIEFDRELAKQIQRLELKPDDDNLKHLNDNIFKPLKKEFNDLKSVFLELGLWSFNLAYNNSMQTIINKIPTVCYDDDADYFQSYIEGLKLKFDDIISKLYTNDEITQNILQFSSEKVNCLIEIFQDANLRPTDEQNEKIHSIVFVERKKIAYYLDILFKTINQRDDFNFIQSDHLYSSSQSNAKDMSILKQKEVLEKFRKHTTNILIATNIVEEGVDIPACNMVIRFSKPHNFGSYIQSKGRARSNNSVYIMLIEDKDLAVFEEELQNFVDIEYEIERNIKKRCEMDDIETEDEIKRLNLLIPQYNKGNSIITCHTAINLINRYCGTMEKSSCSTLYPTYKIEEHEVDGNEMAYRCKVWLPPNPVLSKEIESRFFKRKKWAKMEAALKLCKELDKVGELTDNLTIKSRKEWLKPHYNLEDDELEDETGKTGTTKKKREYHKKIADEIVNNHVKMNDSVYFYIFEISKICLGVADERVARIGYLSSKNLNKIPEFLLYQNQNEYEVTIRNLEERVIIDEQKYDLLDKINKALFEDIFRLKVDFDVDKSLYGGFIVFLTKDEQNSYKIDWKYMQSLNLEKRNLLDFYINKTASNQSQIKLEQLILKFNVNDENIKASSFAKHQSNRLLQIKEIDKTLNPISVFPTEETTFKEYFLEKYGMHTTNDLQPLIEIISCKFNINFILRSFDEPNDEKSSIVRYLFIAEHLTVLPFHVEYLKSLSMIPAIFHRLNSVKKAQKLKDLIENSIVQTLNFKKIPNDSTESWTKSIKLNKPSHRKKINEEINHLERNASVERLDSIIELINDMMLKYSYEDKTKPPELLIKEDNLKESLLNFPNVYHILQSLTSKSAHDNFDFERYEIMGDCFLKLVTVMKIYLQFTNTSEGNIACLKSQRVSNKYLYKLAVSKNLNDYIISENFQPKVNWIIPNQLYTGDEIFKFNLSDKSLADCVEALIGCYLIHSGPNSARAFIQWLDFKVSDQEGKADLIITEKLPEPLLAPLPDSFNMSNYEFFAKTILNYEFKNIVYLYQAFTHPSYTKNRYTASYQKLELIGDAVIDVLVTQYIYSDKKEHSPGELTDLRQALVNNKFFAQLSVKHNFSKYLNYDGIEIMHKINDFSKWCEMNQEDDSVEHLEDQSEVNEAPKCLADLFESVAGAIYLDSNCSLEAVWQVYYPILQPYFIEFKENPPQSPITALYRLKPQSELNLTITKEDDETIATLTVDGDTFKALASNNELAKQKVYKKAVRFYDKDKLIRFF